MREDFIGNYSEMLDTQWDRLVNSWLFMQTPVPIFFILVSYLFFVLKFGPKLMETRKALNLKKLLIAYNAYQVVFNIWLFMQPFRAQQGFMTMLEFCRNIKFEAMQDTVIAQAGWWYFFSKIVDLLDTVFFVLRKKQSQITFLHVYHHSAMVIVTWAYMKLLPGEQGIFLAFSNTVVHSVMYTYYLLSSLGPQYQKYLWWKKYMTTLQLCQFLLMAAYLGYSFTTDCKVPKTLSCLLMTIVGIFFYLFADFYRKTYKAKTTYKK